MRPDWSATAACAGSLALFFPAHGEREQARTIRETKALAACARCQHIDACREWAVNETDGIWAGEIRHGSATKHRYRQRRRQQGAA